MAGKQVVERERVADQAARRGAARAARRPLPRRAHRRARAELGLDEAIARGQAARDLGADAVFVEAPQSVAELDAIARGVPGPKVANMVEGGRTPLLDRDELHELGFDLIVYPVAALLAQARAVEDVYAVLRRDGSSAHVMDRLYPFEQFNALLGLEKHRARESAAVPVEVKTQAPPPATRRRRTA